MISLVVPNWNEAKVLPMFLNSLVSQKYKDFEVVIVDGESTDGSLEIIEGFRDKLNLKVVVCGTRNIGYIRNLGSKFAVGDILFHSSSDTYMDPLLLWKVANHYRWKPTTISLTGRTHPMGTSIFSHFGYRSFDFLRWLFTQFPFPFKKYRPSGNFFTIKKSVFEVIGGFPEVKINEDGLLGYKLDNYARGNEENIKQFVFNFSLQVGHYPKRFETRGGVHTLLFYLYVLGNMFPMLKPLLKVIELRSAEVFSMRKDLKT